MKIKFFPIAQVVVAAALMLIMSYWFPSLNYKIGGSWTIFIFCSIISAILVFLGAYEFRKYATTVNPIDPTRTTDLVTSGVFQYSRNPMYVGFVLFLFGWAALLGSLVSPVVIVLFVWYISQYQIEPEERVLEEKFGSQFLEYKRKVGRWV